MSAVAQLVQSIKFRQVLLHGHKVNQSWPSNTGECIFALVDGSKYVCTYVDAIQITTYNVHNTTTQSWLQQTAPFPLFCLCLPTPQSFSTCLLHHICCILNLDMHKDAALLQLLSQWWQDMHITVNCVCVGHKPGAQTVPVVLHTRVDNGHAHHQPDADGDKTADVHNVGLLMGYNSCWAYCSYFVTTYVDMVTIILYIAKHTYIIDPHITQYS